MEKHQKGSDGRQLFSAEFKQEAVRRVLSGEMAAAGLSRELIAAEQCSTRVAAAVDAFLRGSE